MNCVQRIFSLIAFGFLLAGAACSFADDDLTAEQEMPSVVSGVVTKPNGEPAVGANVTVLISAVREPFTSDKTDASGRFTLRGPKVSPHRQMSLIAGSDGNRLQSIHTLPPIDKDHRLARDAMVIGSHTDLKIELKPAKNINVVATDATGVRIADAVVIVQSGFHNLAEQTTDSNGRAVVTYPSDATLQSVLCYKPNIGFDYRSFESTYVAADRTHPNKLAQQFEGEIEFKLNGVSQASVTVLDPDGKPAVGIRVAPWLIRKPDRGDTLNMSGLSGFGRRTNQDGVAFFDFLPRDHQRGMTFWPRIEHPRWFFPQRANVDWESPGRRVSVQARRTIPVSGTVTHADGTPAADIRIVGYGASYSTDDFRESTSSGAAGRWSMNVYPDGYYIFSVRDKSYAANAHAGMIIREGLQGLNNLDFSLYEAIRVHGTVRIAGKPSAPTRGYIMLQQHSPSYYDLPEETRLPNPKNSNRGISSFIQETTTVNEDGTYAFFVGRGDFVIWSPDQKTQKFSITDQASVKFDFDLDAPLKIVSKGSVIGADDPHQVVAGARVIGRAAEFIRGDLDAVTDSKGEFEAERDNIEMVVWASSEDRSHAGVVKLAPGQREFDIPIAPTCTAFGQLISEEGELLAGRAIEYGIELESNGMMSWLVRTSTQTDDQGNFLLRGMVAGHEHKVSVVAGFGANGEATSWRNMTKVTPTEPIADLRHIVLDRVPPAITPNKRASLAFGLTGDPAQRWQETRRDARLSNQHVMLVAGSSTSREAIDFFSAFDRPLVRQELSGFRLLSLELNADQPENQRLLQSIAPQRVTAQGDLEIYVLDSEGKRHASTTHTELTADSRPIDEGLLEFALEHAPETDTADELLRRATERAGKEGKQIFLQITSASSLPGLMLSRFLDRHQDLWSKDFVWLKLDVDQNFGAEVLAQRFRGEEQYSLPWSAVLSKDGDLVQAGEAEGVSIGFPLTTAARDKFKQMFLIDRRRMSRDEIETIVQALENPEARK